MPACVGSTSLMSTVVISLIVWNAQVQVVSVLEEGEGSLHPTIEGRETGR